MTLDDLPSGHIVLASWARTQDAKERRLCGSLGLCVFDRTREMRDEGRRMGRPSSEGCGCEHKGGL